MDLTTAISRIHHLYVRIASNSTPAPGFGYKIERYNTRSGSGLLFIVLEPPVKKVKGKKKDYDKAIEKSENTGKCILPKDFPNIVSYLSSEFSKIIKPRAELLQYLQKLMAGLRLELIPMENMKYVFKNPIEPQIIVYDTIVKGQFAFYINIVDIEEQGLILAHERQMEYIITEIKNGKDPVQIKNLPAIRTGETEFHPRKSPLDDNEEEKQEPETVAKFRESIKQKKIQDEIENELDLETIIDFNPRPEAEQQESATIKRDLFGRPLPANVSPSNPDPIPLSGDGIKSTPKPKPAPAPLITPQMSPKDADLLSEQPNQIDNTPNLEKLRTEIIELRQKIQKYDHLEEENSRLQDQILLVTDSLTLQLAQKDTKIKEIQKQKEKLDFQLNEVNQLSKKKEEKFQFIINKLTNANEDLIKNLAAIESEKEQKVQIENNHGEEMEKLRETINEYFEENNLLAQSIKETDEKNKMLTAQIKTINDDRQKVLNEKLNLEIMLTELQDRIFELESDIEKKEHEISQKTEEKNEIQTHIEEIIKERESTLSDLENQTQNLDKGE
ncbi:hypothetical protein NEF87_004170 [Candidatus Lokiarchaeum ossiferum]|uniref:Uncharacterized protein n=1 Tax=Candidatus Lokiarchaeum ossiferum TaxID=2951803 RepID=A0ABY6HWT9_9ARCH|nr:hypothetical protein NEF87_004170 [Candidatus Lokiarchaeum sp. B-35]